MSHYSKLKPEFSTTWAILYLLSSIKEKPKLAILSSYIFPSSLVKFLSSLSPSMIKKNPKQTKICIKIKAVLTQHWPRSPLHCTSSSLFHPKPLIKVFQGNNRTQRQIQLITARPSSQLGPQRLPEYSEGPAYFVKPTYTHRQTILSTFRSLSWSPTLNPLLRIPKRKKKKSHPKKPHPQNP